MMKTISRRRRAWADRAWVGLCIAILATVGGCGAKHRFKPRLLVSSSDIERYLRGAVEDPDPDLRRAYIGQVRRSRYVSRSVVGQTLRLIARTDPNTSVRCAAIQAFVDLPDTSESLATLARILDGPERNPDVIAADSDVRWTAAETACALLDRSTDTAQRDAYTALGARLLNRDPSRNVRIAAARLLGCCARREAVSALVAGLRQRDFGVAFECGRSLSELTGHDYQVDARRWSRWLGTVDDPFADRREADARLAASPPVPWWRLDRLLFQPDQRPETTPSGENRPAPAGADGIMGAPAPSRPDE